MLKSYRITQTVDIVIAARNKPEAIRMAFEQEYRAVDLMEFSGSAKIIEDKD